MKTYRKPIENLYKTYENLWKSYENLETQCGPQMEHRFVPYRMERSDTASLDSEVYGRGHAG